jgi:hypothetical protein
MNTRFLQDRWNRLPPRWRLVFLASVTCAAAALAALLLLRKGGVREVLYKAF